MHFAFLKFLKKYARPEYRVPFGHDRVLEDLALRKHRDACRLTFNYDNTRFSEFFYLLLPLPHVRFFSYTLNTLAFIIILFICIYYVQFKTYGMFVQILSRLMSILKSTKQIFRQCASVPSPHFALFNFIIELRKLFTECLVLNWKVTHVAKY